MLVKAIIIIINNNNNQLYSPRVEQVTDKTNKLVALCSGMACNICW